MLTELKPLTVLLVDDEPLIRWAVSQSLSEAGYEVAEAGDAAGALRAVTTAQLAFDVILLDFRLPDSDDFKLLTAIRTRAPQSAVVLMTASGTPEMVAEADRLGVFRVVNKPFDLVEVHNMVAAASAA
jgi:DNA-binding NtrC family response regulator